MNNNQGLGKCYQPRSWPRLEMLLTPMAERTDVMYIFVYQKLLVAFHAKSTVQLSDSDSATAFISVYIVLTICLLIGNQLTVNFGNWCNLQICKLSDGR